MYYAAFALLCAEKGIRPIDVSRATGISTATLTSWKKGRYTPKLDKLQKIADFLGVPLSLITGQSAVHADGQPEWYTDPETARLAQAAFDRPDLGILMDASSDLPPESVLALVEIAKRMKGNND